MPDKKKEPKVKIVVSPIYDALTGLYVLADPKYCLDSEAAQASRIIETLRPRLKTNLSLLFDSDCYPGLGLLSLVDDKYTKDIPSLIKAINEIPDNELGFALLSFGKIFRGNLKVQIRIEELLQNRTLLEEHIRKNMSVPEEKVAGLVHVLLNLQETRENLAELIEHFWYISMQGESEQRRQTQQKAADRLEELLLERGSKNLVYNITQLNLSSDGDIYEEVILAPSSFSGMGMAATENKDESVLVVTLGAEHPVYKNTDCEEKEETQYSSEKIAKFFSVMGDKTRLEILKALGEKPYYGQEIAQLFNISNATAFYHLSHLQKTGAVRIERIEHRVYYVLDKELLRGILTQGLDNFLG